MLDISHIVYNVRLQHELQIFHSVSHLDNDEVEDEEPQPDEGDDALAVCQGEVDVGAELHLVVHPSYDHHVTHEAEPDHPDVGADDTKAFYFYFYMITSIIFT